ncbi:hypothetical protein [Weissella viridescens]|uniref:hypothetical protein n=1 Tax=Weissella viridescens TaxID=1629 RepID=UPI003AF251D9
MESFNSSVIAFNVTPFNNSFVNSLSSINEQLNNATKGLSDVNSSIQLSLEKFSNTVDVASTLSKRINRMTLDMPDYSKLARQTMIKNISIPKIDIVVPKLPNSFYRSQIAIYETSLRISDMLASHPDLQASSKSEANHFVNVDERAPAIELDRPSNQYWKKAIEDLETLRKFLSSIYERKLVKAVFQHYFVDNLWDLIDRGIVYPLLLVLLSWLLKIATLFK